jgi:long-chain acyl-CoA synthetase
MISELGLLYRLNDYATRFPNREALISLDKSLSYSQLIQQVEQCSFYLAEKDISSDSIVGIQIENDIDHIVVCLACLRLGSASLTLSTFENDLARQAMKEKLGISYVATQKDIDEYLKNHNPINKEGDLDEQEYPQASLLFSTSGTTGEPKLVEFFDQDLVAQAHRHIQSHEERFACVARVEHNFAKRHRLYCLAMGATNIFLPQDITNLVSAKCTLKFNVLHVSAFQAQEILTLPDRSQLNGIRLKLGGSHVALEIRKRLVNEVTSSVEAGYGTTETGAISFTEPSKTINNESVGACLPGIKISIRDTDEKELEFGEKGEVWISGSGLFRGYKGKPDLTNEKLQEGWFRTGDIAYLDASDCIHLSGRADDMFVFNSMNIYPQEIEAIIRQHPAVNDAAVFAKSSATHDNIPVALIVLKAKKSPEDNAEENYSPESIEQFVEKNIGIRGPRQLAIVEEIPRNSAGKILRSTLPSLLVRRENIRKTISHALKRDPGKLISKSRLKSFEEGVKDIALDELELDSINRMELLVALETQHDLIVSPEQLSNLNSLFELARFSNSDTSFSHQWMDSTVSKLTSKTKSETAPHIVKLIRRLAKLNPTIAQFNQALIYLGDRITPLEIDTLNQWQAEERLLGFDSTFNSLSNYDSAIIQWLHSLDELLGKDKNKSSVNYSMQKILPALTLYRGQGNSKDKTLLLCFSGRGIRHLSIPNAALMLSTNPNEYDIMVVSEPYGRSYSKGIPCMGKNMDEVIACLSQNEYLRSYSSIRTIGYSAGCYPAILVGYALNAELILSCGGRFHRFQHHPIRYISRYFSLKNAVKKNKQPLLLLLHAIDNPRDRRFAKLISKISGGIRLEIYLDKKKAHHLLADLLERKSLNDFFKQYLFLNKKYYNQIFNKNIIKYFPKRASE